VVATRWKISPFSPTVDSNPKVPTSQP